MGLLCVAVSSLSLMLSFFPNSFTHFTFLPKGCAFDVIFPGGNINIEFPFYMSIANQVVPHMKAVLFLENLPYFKRAKVLVLSLTYCGGADLDRSCGLQTEVADCRQKLWTEMATVCIGSITGNVMTY